MRKANRSLAHEQPVTLPWPQAPTALLLSPSRRHLAIDKSKHDNLVRRGEGAIAREEIHELREVTTMLGDYTVKNIETAQIHTVAHGPWAFAGRSTALALRLHAVEEQAT